MKKLFLGSVALVALGLGAPAALAADRAVPAYAPPPPPAPVYTWTGCYAGANGISQTQERWLVTARGKLGLAGWGWFGDKSMVYVTGGAAWAKIDTSEFLVGVQTGTGHQESNTRTGWTVGAGYEYALGYGWSIKGE